MIFIHKSADVSKSATVGKDVSVWNNAQIRENAKIGSNCSIGKDAYIDHDVVIGNNCKIQNQALIYFGTTIEDDVFIGPQVCFANDKNPRAVLPDGSAKKNSDWKVGSILVKKGASIGAGAILIPNLVIGNWAMIGAGSVVVKDVPDYGLVFGNPATLKGYVCLCGNKLNKKENKIYNCEHCGKSISIEE